jgi:hypothetical protein
MVGLSRFKLGYAGYVATCVPNSKNGGNPGFSMRLARLDMASIANAW